MQDESKIKGKWGGKRPNQTGRPKRMEEEQIISRLKPMEETAFKVLNQKILDGDMNAIKLFMAYYIGMPTQKMESKIEGQLNSVSIEVVKPAMAPNEIINN
jgi:hypothetical protein